MGFVSLLPHFCEMQKGKGVCYSHICTPLTGYTTGFHWRAPDIAGNGDQNSTH